MSAAHSLLKTYSFASRKRAKKTARTESKYVPAGLAFSKRYALPLRKQALLLDPKVERVNGRVLCRCMSISRAGSVLLSSSMFLQGQNSMLRYTLEGVLRSAGSNTGKWAADATAGLCKDVLGETVDHLHKCASEEVTHASGSVVVDWLSKIDKALLARLAAYTAVVDTPVHQYWEDFLDNVIMPSDPNGPLAVAIKVLLDQGLMAPMATALMLVVFKLLEGKKEHALPELRQRLVERLVPDWAVWPMARVIEFTLVPQEARAVYEGMVGIATCAFGLYRLREKVRARMESLPTSVRDATSQALSSSIEMADATPSTSPHPHSPMSAFNHLKAFMQRSLPHMTVRSARVSPLSRETSMLSPIGGMSSSSSSTAAAAAAFGTNEGLVAAAAALRSSGILPAFTAVPCLSMQKSTGTRVPGLVPRIEEMHSPFHALAHKPLNLSRNSREFDKLWSDGGLSRGGTGSMEHAPVSRLALVSESSG